MFATKIELKDQDLERENFLILNIQDYFPLNIVYNQNELISLNEIDKIISNLDIKKARVIDQVNNKLIKHIKPGLIKFFHIFF